MESRPVGSSQIPDCDVLALQNVNHFGWELHQFKAYWQRKDDAIVKEVAQSNFAYQRRSGRYGANSKPSHYWTYQVAQGVVLYGIRRLKSDIAELGFLSWSENKRKIVD